ncbi:hypothetical protein GPJ56_005833 [Histomonas meleagridis]|uniref:uncharacterized protein n=1 Tax=Histomonas meleagridis TaxID=135588 RepID=UPI003559EBCF|nr:hypothetical protein GPJ56_005833 [Histomonas meleagridis]KAH0798631.1 hypothetical protein GO595_008496 [Histomonas meleagridis]
MRVTVSKPFITVKLKESYSSQERMVMMPKTLESLKKQGQMIFRSPKPIQTIYLESGELVRNISEIQPGSVLMLSTKKENQNQENTINDEGIFDNFKMFTLLSDDSDPDDKYKLSNTNELSLKSFKTNSDQDLLESDKSRDSNEFAFDLDEEEDFISFPKRENSSDNRTLSSSFNKAEALAFRNSSSDEEDSSNQELNSLLNSILGAKFLTNDSSFIESTLRNSKTISFYKKAKLEEKHQHQFTFQNLLSHFPKINKDKLTLYPELMTRVQSIVSKRRIITPGCVSYHFKDVIVGPRNSGKSTYLSLITEQFLQELIAVNTLNQNFIFIFDSKKLSISFSNFTDFYLNYVHLILDFLHVQRPGIQQYLDGIINYFTSLIQNETLPILPKQLLTDEDFKVSAKLLARIGEQIFQCYNDPTSFEPFVTNVILLPTLISSAFGFLSVHYIIDNFEYLNFKISSFEPFVECNETINLLDFFEYAISDCSYLITYENTNYFFDLFNMKKELLRDVEFIDVFGLNGEFYGKDKSFVIKFESDPMLYKFDVKDCNGCAAFLAFWEEVCEEIDENNCNWKVNVEKFNEQQLKVKELLEFILKNVFDDVGNEMSKVVRRPIVEIHPITNV